MRISDWSSDVCSSDLEPGDGYWSNVWNAQPFSTSYWGGRPTQDQMYTTAYYSEADWNDTRFFRPDFDKLLLSARAELDPATPPSMYRAIAITGRDEGRVLLPRCNAFISDGTKKTKRK